MKARPTSQNDRPVMKQKNLKQKWWYFEFDENGDIRLADKNMFKYRPEGANPSEDNPYTAWYETKDHYDEKHIHIKAMDYSIAFRKAVSIKEKMNNSIPKIQSN